MNILKHRSGAEAVREGRLTISEEFARRRAVEEDRLRREVTGPSPDEAAAASRAAAAATAAQRVEQLRQIESLRDFRGQVEQIKGLAESNRSSAIYHLDFEAAIEAAHRAAGLVELIAEINESGRHSFGGSWS